jgi:DNA-binding transcriptional regulator LsrR (DeoR family)
MGDPGRTHPARLEQAARAAWLYYVGRRTQDEIAVQLNISRQTAQRLISLAVAEKLIKFRFDHPIGPCMDLSRALSDRYGLGFCDVVPQAGEDEGLVAAIAVAGAQYLERWFTQRAPMVLGLATGRTLRAIANELSPVDAPQHKVIALCGTMLPAGRAISSDPVMRIAERTGAQCFPMPTPVIAASVEEKRLLQAQRPFATLRDLLSQARCLMIGIGHIGWQAPLHHDGFVSDAELTELIEAGAVGEIAGWSFDQHGQLLSCSINQRVAGLRPTENESAMRVGVGGGPQKVAAIRAALAGRLITGLITDERTARAVLGGNGFA